jgi:hypothetical protein
MAPNCRTAEPVNAPTSIPACIRLSGLWSSKAIRFPRRVTLAIPVTTVPPQQKRYAPVEALPIKTVLRLVSSCKQTLPTVTTKLHSAVLFEVSLAVQMTVFVPNGKQYPDGGTQATVASGQLSLIAGEGKVATPHGSEPTIIVVFGGQVIVGFVVSLTVTVNMQLA